jgi:PAS domain S-box-containing protein
MPAARGVAASLPEPASNIKCALRGTVVLLLRTRIQITLLLIEPLTTPLTHTACCTASAIEPEASLLAETSARRSLQAQFDLRNSALDAASTFFMILDVSRASWKIVYVNRALCERHGYCPAELLNQSPLLLVCSEGNEAALATAADAVRLGTTSSIEVAARCKDGSSFWVGMRLLPLSAAALDGRHYVCVAADITKRLEYERTARQLQEQLVNEMRQRERIAIELRLAQKLESVGRLAAGIAHEINTPIQYVGDSVTFLRSAESDLRNLRAAYRRAIERLVANEPAQQVTAELETLESTMDLPFLSEEIPKAFERTIEGVERVAAIVRAMKEFAYPDAVRHEYADLNHALETTLTVARNEYKYHALIETRFGTLPPVSCNVGELNQVFLNLIVNAAHAIGESGKSVTEGRICLSTGAADDEVCICFADNGCGINTENLEKIFDPFFTTKPVGRGTGQGLAIARAIVAEKHRGRIEVRSEVGTGTTFTLYLPIAARLNEESPP